MVKQVIYYILNIPAFSIRHALYLIITFIYPKTLSIIKYFNIFVL